MPNGAVQNMRVMRQPTDHREWTAVMRELAQYLHAQQDVTYSASMTPDMLQGDWVRITPTNGTDFTINAPKNPWKGGFLNITIRNASGGVHGNITWDAVFKIGAGWTKPANGFSRSIQFRYDGTNWVETYRTTAGDVAN